MKGLTAVLLASILFGFIGSSTVFIGKAVPTGSLVFLRALLAVFPLLLVFPFIDKNFLKISKKDLTEFAVMGFLLALNFFLFMTALQHARVATVHVANAVYIVFAAVLAFLFLKEKIRKPELLAIILAVLGIAAVNPLSESVGGFGVLLAMLSALVFAFFLVFLRFVERSHNAGSIFWMFFFAALFSLPFPLLQGFGKALDFLPLILVLGIGSTGIGYLLFAFGLKSTKVEIAAPLSLSIVMITDSLLSVFFLKQSITSNLIAGGVLLIASAFVLEFFAKPKKGHFLKKHFK